MNIIIDTHDGPRLFALSLTAHRSGGVTKRLCLGDLVDAAGGFARTDTVGGDTVSVDGVPLDRGTPLEEVHLHPGSRISPVDATFVGRSGLSGLSGRLRRPRAALGSIDVVAGLDAGLRHALQPGRYLIGRSPSADVVVESATVSRRHARVEVFADGSLRIADVGSRNGIGIGDRQLGDVEALPWDVPVRLGAAMVLARRPSADAPEHLAAQQTLTGSGTLLAFNRMPRKRLPVPPDRLELPTRRAPEHHRSRFSWAAIVAPLILGAAMAVLWNPFYALFMVLSPVMTLMNHWEDKHRLRREHKQIEADFRQAISRFESELDVHLRRERVRRTSRHIDLAELRRRAVRPSVHLWERRPQHGDAFEVAVGRGDLRLDSAVAATTGTASTASTAVEAEVAELLDRVGMLRNVPIDVTVRGGTVVGTTGRRNVAQSVVRAILASVVCNHGPADLEVMVLCSPGQVGEWDWVALLPHVADRDSALAHLLVGTTVEESLSLVNRLLEREPPDERTTIVVIDGPEFHEGRHAAVRRLAGVERCAMLVVAESIDWLPSQTSAVIETGGDDGVGRFMNPADPAAAIDVVLDGLSGSTAWVIASGLARFEDPELISTGAGIPRHVSLESLMGGAIDADAVARRWAACRRTPGLLTPIGSDQHGPVMIDLVADGPHALIGGTTGSGKSELLRSMVASMAATADTDHLAFVLIDYKGGSAFDRCADLPHTVGVVTDLDPHLSERALRCLHAELEYRERVLRGAGADSIDSYRQRRDLHPDLEPLPRLVVVIDEFATLVTELPDFVDSLVGIAQRGRSLGIHLVLATQRPSGAINDNIRTNTNIRVALRMLDTADSVDVIGTSAAASIGRDTPGRAYVRLGPGQLVNFQSAFATGARSASQDWLVTPVPFGETREIPAQPEQPTRDSGPQNLATDLEVMVGAISAAHRQLGGANPRCPWPAALPTTLLLRDIDAQNRGQPTPDPSDAVVFGEIDDPDNQRRVPATWNPFAGNAFVAGAAQSGVTSTLRTMVISTCCTYDADRVAVYVLDFGGGGFGDLVALPHVGAVVGPSEIERQQRLLHILAAEVRRRKSDPASEATPIVFVLDGLDSFRRENDDRYDLLDLLDTVYLDGPSAGVITLVSAASPTELRHFGATTRFRLYLRTDDPMDLREIGVRGAIDPEPAPGRGHIAPHGLVVQVAQTVEADLEAALAHNPPITAPKAVGVMGTELPAKALRPVASLDDAGLWIPLGPRKSDLETVGFHFGLGDHALIAGPSRSGKTTTLDSLATHLTEASVCAVRWIREPGDLDWCENVLGRTSERTVVLIDDVEAVAEHPVLSEILASRDSPIHLVVAGRVDRLRNAYGHWSTEFRQVRRGLLLWPDILDGDVVGVDLPSRTATAAVPGRGVLLQAGSCTELQVARWLAGEASCD